MGSFMFDGQSLTDAMLRRLAGRAAFDATILVDKESFDERTCMGMRPRLDALRRAGATVVICKGEGRFGAFHVNAAVVDRRYCYTGSANFTEKSARNVEIMLRLVGPGVADILAILEDAKASGRVWE